MIATVLEELRASAETDLPGWIRAVAAARAVPLTDRVAVRTWFASAAELLTLAFPALELQWGGSAVRRRQATHTRTHDHPLVLSYLYRSADPADVERHMTYIGEAIALWLDHFPRATSQNAKTILDIAPPDGDAYPMTPDVQRLKDGTSTVFIWALDVEVTVKAFDPSLPMAPIAAP